MDRITPSATEATVSVTVTLRGARSVGSDESVTACSRHASITQSSFTAPKIPQTLPVHLPICVLSCEFVVLCDSGHRKLTITFSLAWTSVWNRCSMEKGWVGPKHPAALAWRCHRGLLFPAPPIGAPSPVLPEPALSLPVDSKSRDSPPRGCLSAGPESVLAARH